MLKQEPHNGGFIGLPTARPGLYEEVILLKEETIGIIFEMTRPLPTKNGSIEGGMGHARSSVAILSFFDIHGRYCLNGRCPHGQPNNKEL